MRRDSSLGSPLRTEPLLQTDPRWLLVLGIVFLASSFAVGVSLLLRF